MITKERDEQKTNNIPFESNAKNGQIKKDIHDLEDKYNTRWKILIWSIIIIFVVLLLIVAYILNVFDMAIYNPYETKIINVTSEDKDWYKNENINLFEYLNKHGDKVIWPGASGEYTFIIRNSATQPIYYKFSMEDKNEYNINMKYRLKMNNVYVKGDEDTWLTADEMAIEDIYILKDSESLYTLEWEWQKDSNDAEIKKEGLATYTVYIDIYSKFESEDLWK